NTRLADCRKASAGAAVVIVSNGATLLGLHVAEKTGARLIRGYIAPFGANWGGAVSRQAMWTFARPWVNAARREVLGLPALPWRERYGSLDQRQVPLLYGFSSTVFSPKERGDWVHTTGYWFLDRPSDWRPPAP